MVSPAAVADGATIGGGAIGAGATVAGAAAGVGDEAVVSSARSEIGRVRAVRKRIERRGCR